MKFFVCNYFYEDGVSVFLDFAYLCQRDYNRNGRCIEFMYAVFKTGGKQYRVTEGDVIFVEKLNLKDDSAVDFTDVILVNDGKKTTIGTPLVKGAKITGKLLKNGKSKKITVFTYKPKKGSKRKMGHRQPYSKIQIESIKL